MGGPMSAAWSGVDSPKGISNFAQTASPGESTIGFMAPMAVAMARYVGPTHLPARPFLSAHGIFVFRPTDSDSTPSPGKANSTRLVTTGDIVFFRGTRS